MTLSSRLVRLSALVLALAAALAAFPAAPPARAASPTVAYVYNTDTASRDSFKAELELRGFSVTPVSLAEADADVPDPNFSQYEIIIIGHDTGDIGGSTWLGGGLARDRIVRAGKYTVGVGFGGAQFFDTLSLDIGFSHGATAQSSSAQAVNPADSAWGAPNAVPLAAGGWAHLYPGDVGGRFANPPSLAGVTLIGRTVGVQGLALYPIAAESLAGTPQCFLLWGHRGSPAFMTPDGRGLFENLLRMNPCAAQQRPKSDISVTKKGPSTGKVGEPITYVITVTAVKAAAPGVRVVDQLPANAVLISATPSQGACVAHPHEVVCELGDLAAGASATVTVVLKPTELGRLLNRASATGKFEDVSPNNNSAEAATEVGYSPLLPPLKALPFTPVFDGPIVAPNFPKDLSIFGVEMTQGIQCFDTSKGLAGCADNSLSLVARKSTVARIYLRYSGLAASMNNVPVRLVLIDANNVEYTVNALGKALPAIDQSSSANSANIYFSVNFNSKVPVRYYAVVDPNGAIAETNEANNRFPAVGTRSIDFTPSRTMRIVGQRLRYHPSGYGGEQYAGGWAVNGGAALWLNQLLPIRSGGITYQVASGYMNWTTSLGSGDGQHSLISALNVRWIQQNVFSWLFGTGAYTGARHVYGWAPNAGYSGGHADMPVYPHAGGLGVVAIGTDRPGTSTDDPGGGALIFGHELVHDYDLKHTDTADSCGSSDDTSAFPYGSSSIQEFGFNPVTAKVYNPATTHDLMSYCPAGGSKQGWISPYTWSSMFTKLKAGGVASLDQTADVALAVNLSVSNPDLGAEQGAFGEVTKINAPTPLVTPAPGDYAVELRAGAVVKSTTTFSVTFHSEYSAHTGDHPGDPAETASASAHMVIPWQDGVTELAIMHNGVQIGSRAVSAAAPVVQFTSPSAPESWAAGSAHTLSWQGQDADSASLSYSLLYSRDGAEWDILASGLTATSYEVQTDDLAGSSAGRFRVVASDGVNIGDDESPLIDVPDQAPVASILNPLDGSDVTNGDLLVLQGFGGDMEDGVLPDISMEWKSDGASVGVGSSLPLAGLTPGLHQIVLSVTDSGGHTATASAEIFVGSRLRLPLVIR